MDETRKKQIYDLAWKQWGDRAQMDLLIEEMAELTQAIIKARRRGCLYTYAILEEMADVLIMLEQLENQLKDIPNPEYGSFWRQVISIKEAKLNRLEERLIK